MVKPAAFLDRDGVINKEKGYVFKIKDFEWVKDSIKAIRLLNEKNFYVFIVTNQSGIARGYYNERDVETLHNHISTELSKYSAHIDEFFYSPYHPDHNNLKYNHLSNLRKPKTGMLELAFDRWNIIKDKSFMIGDKDIDIQCASNFGIKGHLFKGGSLLNFLRNVENL